MYKIVKKRMIEKSNLEKAEKMSAYMRDQFAFYGLDSKTRRDCYKDILKELKNKDVDFELIKKCFEDDYREMQYFALDYLHTVNKKLRYEDLSFLRKLVETKSWWDSIDNLDRIIGNIAFVDDETYKKISEAMLNWSTDANFWVRRIAIDHQLLRKEKTDTELLEKIIINNFGSNEFFINKAIGWSLREYSKTNKEWVKNFVNKHRDKMANLSIREASKYLD